MGEVLQHPTARRLLEENDVLRMQNRQLYARMRSYEGTLQYFVQIASVTDSLPKKEREIWQRIACMATVALELETQTLTITGGGDGQNNL